MDESVLGAMARWPDVPAVYGWLELDRRGLWRLRGEPLGHPGLEAFISRNYARDKRGCWYFQNGPQRVFVHLEYTPWVYRLEPGGDLRSHTGAPAGAVQQLFMDEDGAVLLATALGIGLLDDRDLALFSAALCDAAGGWLADEVIADKLSALADGAGSGGAALYFRHQGDCLPLQSIRRTQVSTLYNFEPEPKAPQEPATARSEGEGMGR